MQEGNTWEAVMAAGVKRPGSLTAILDANGLQGDDRVASQMNYEPIVDKLAAFGWEVDEIDGHDREAILRALEHAPADGARPHFIVARTIKGKGVSYMEDQQYWHGSVPISVQELDRARHELAGESSS
jgi:transketolase